MRITIKSVNDEAVELSVEPDGHDLLLYMRDTDLPGIGMEQTFRLQDIMDALVFLAPKLESAE